MQVIESIKTFKKKLREEKNVIILDWIVLISFLLFLLNLFLILTSSEMLNDTLSSITTITLGLSFLISACLRTIIFDEKK